MILPCPLPLYTLALSKLDRRHTGRLRKREMVGGRGGGGGGEAKSHDSKKAWPSINHSILSDLSPLRQRVFECFIENHTLSPSYDLAIPHPYPPLRKVSSTDDTQEDWERETTRGRGRGGEKSYDGKKASSSVNHSILSASSCFYCLHIIMF
jgi:hypothetical protein